MKHLFWIHGRHRPGIGGQRPAAYGVIIPDECFSRRTVAPGITVFSEYALLVTPNPLELNHGPAKGNAVFYRDNTKPPEESPQKGPPVITKPRGQTLPVMHRILLRLLLLSTVLAPLCARAQTAFLALAALQAKGAHVSALAVDLQTSSTVWQIDPLQALTPASVSKLYTVGAALDRWGPDHRFTTRILTTGKVSGDTLKGDLVFMGAGDPTLSDRDLWLLAVRVKNRGIKTVSGKLVVNESLFGHLPCGEKDRCRALKKSGNAYDAPISAAGVNFGTWCAQVRPASAAGKPAHIGFCSLDLPAVPILGKVDTAPAGSPPGLIADRRTIRGEDRLWLSGNIAQDSAPKQVYRSSSNAPRETGIILRQMLANLGVTINGDTEISEAPMPDSATVLASTQGEPLNEQLARMMAYSNNYMADVLALDLVAYGDADRPVTLASAGDVLQSLAINADQAPGGEFSEIPGKPRFLSGSGLTTANKLSASDIVALLSYMYHRTELFPSFLGSLSVPEYSPLHMLSHGRGTWLTHIAVKTGSLNNPVSVMALAGYYRCDGGHWGAFAALINGEEATVKRFLWNF